MPFVIRLFAHSLLNPQLLNYIFLVACPMFVCQTSMFLGYSCVCMKTWYADKVADFSRADYDFSSVFRQSLPSDYLT